MTTKSDKQPIRHRVEVACTRCRYRKTRCCGSRPSCQTCLKFKKECVYVSIEDSKTTPRGMYVPGSSSEIGRTNKRQPSALLSEAKGGSKPVAEAEMSLARNEADTLASSTKVHQEDLVQLPYETFFPALSSSVASTSSDTYEEPVEFELSNFVEPDIFFHRQSAQPGTYEDSCGSVSPADILTFPTTHFQDRLQQTTEPDPIPESYLVLALTPQQSHMGHTPTSCSTASYQPASVSIPEYTHQFPSTLAHPSNPSDPDRIYHPLEQTTGEPFFLDSHKYRRSPLSIPSPAPAPVPISAPSPMLSTYNAHLHPALAPQEDPISVVGWNPDLTGRRNVGSGEHPDESLAWEDLLR